MNGPSNETGGFAVMGTGPIGLLLALIGLAVTAYSTLARRLSRRTIS